MRAWRNREFRKVMLKARKIYTATVEPPNRFRTAVKDSESFMEFDLAAATAFRPWSIREWCEGVKKKVSSRFRLHLHPCRMN